MCDRLLLGPPVCICNGKRGGRQWAGSLPSPTAVQTPKSPEKRKPTAKTHISHMYTPQRKTPFNHLRLEYFLLPS